MIFLIKHCRKKWCSFCDILKEQWRNGFIWMRTSEIKPRHLGGNQTNWHIGCNYGYQCSMQYKRFISCIANGTELCSTRLHGFGTSIGFWHLLLDLGSTQLMVHCSLNVMKVTAVNYCFYVQVTWWIRKISSYEGNCFKSSGKRFFGQKAV